MRHGAACFTILAVLALVDGAHPARGESVSGAARPSAPAQSEGLGMSGSLRARYEALGGQFRPGKDAAQQALLLRTTLAANYATGPLRLGAELFDSRVYGAGPGSSVGTSEVNTLELVQLNAGLVVDKMAGGGRLALTGGRFTMDLGSRRLVARNNFRNTTNAFTGVRAELSGVRLSGGQTFAATAFYTLPQIRRPSDAASVLGNRPGWDREDGAFRFWGALAEVQGLPGGVGANAYLYGLDEDDQPDIATRNRHLVTPGLRLYRKAAPGKWDGELEVAGQWGHVRTGTAANAPQVDVAAWYAHGEIGRSFAGPMRPRLSASVDLASGDHVGSASYNRFDNLFGARRPDFGPTSLYGLLGPANIVSPGVRLELRPKARWDAMLAGRAAWLESATDSFASSGVRDPNGGSGRFAGNQIEGRMRYWLLPDRLRLEAGGALFLRGHFLHDAPGAAVNGDSRYGYVELSATF